MLKLNARPARRRAARALTVSSKISPTHVVVHFPVIRASKAGVPHESTTPVLVPLAYPVVWEVEPGKFWTLRDVLQAQQQGDALFGEPLDL